MIRYLLSPFIKRPTIIIIQTSSKQQQQRTMSACELFAKAPLMAPNEHPSTEDILKQQGEGFTLKGKTALITGGSSGLGAETARAFASKGAR